MVMTCGKNARRETVKQVLNNIPEGKRPVESQERDR
jgi:hypothetical protein